MMRRTVMSIIVIISLMISFAMAEPSQWAVDLVESSEANGLVPETLKSNYQETILRYEYVLLGLEILNKYGVSVEINNDKPFKDIGGHPYQTEIVKAYNAGIISGYTDDTFRPNNPISREEITALVYNLVKAINSQVVLEGDDNLFYDESAIENWAKPFVNFAYINNIMSGTGTFNRMIQISPKGKATREQAIILLYKLSLNTDLLNKTIPSVLINGELNNQINELVLKTNYTFGEKVFEIQNKTDVQLDMLSNEFLAMSYGNKGSTQINITHDLKEFNVTTLDLNDTIIEDYYDLIETIYGKSLVNMMSQHVSALKANSTYKYNDVLIDNLYLHVFYDPELKQYAIQIDDWNQ